MECYNIECKEECDEYKRMSCIFRDSKEVFEYKKRIGCNKCGKRLVRGKVKGEEVLVCTNCLSISPLTGNKGE